MHYDFYYYTCAAASVVCVHHIVIEQMFLIPLSNDAHYHESFFYLLF